MSMEHFDVIIIGAGLSGIGAAVHMQKQCPDKRVCLLEARDDLGGTWDLFRYPGIRSDSDMFTLGYSFKPWTAPKAIADGDAIKAYIAEAADEYGILPLIRFQHKVAKANWQSQQQHWLLDVDGPQGRQQLSSQFILCCTGYYNYAQGHEPSFPEQDSFQGEIIHPQKWPTQYDYQGKKVVVIGSGATAVTLVPAMAEQAAHVTMLQRSPTYVMSVPQSNLLFEACKAILPAHWVYHLARTQMIVLTSLWYNYCRTFPNSARSIMLKLIKKQLGKDADLSHFTPHYNPWDERLCAVPEGDLFKVLREKTASIVTDHIQRFTADGIELVSGQQLDADVIVTATGLEIQLFGQIQLCIDDQPITTHDKMIYRGTLLEDIPNAAMIFGYTNASWTLKSDLISEWLCRLFKHMDKQGSQVVTPRNQDLGMAKQPFLDLNSGYVQRAADKVPKQGSKRPWKLYQHYVLDLVSLKFEPITDSALEFAPALAPTVPISQAQSA